MIIYFSGTGNTRYAALTLGALLGDSDVRAFTVGELREPSEALVDCRQGDGVVWAFPTYSWGIPPVVAAVMENCTYGSGARAARHYMLTTCGDDMAYTDHQWRSIMHRRGLDAAGAYALQMPNTYTLMKGFDVDSPDVAAIKLKKAPEALRRIAQAISEGGGDILLRLKFSWLKSEIIYPGFKRFAMSPKPFRFTGGCVGCGLCAKSCPMANITMIKDPTDGKTETPQWGDACALCLRCYHICPRHAVAYGKATDGKGQYLFPE